MSGAKSTKLNVREDRPTAIASRTYGSSADAAAFNITFIANRNPGLAVEIMKLYTEAQKIKESDPTAPEEDFALFKDEVFKAIPDDSGEDE